VQGDEVGLLEEAVLLDVLDAELPLRAPVAHRVVIEEPHAEAAARRATAWPIRPSPRTPSALPWTSWPSSSMSPHSVNLPARVYASASTTRRAVARRRAQVKSAVVSVRTPGVLVTTIFRRVAAGPSMLS
jgi:hypothetical protein